ncbi:MAG: M20/M25/M40 family metallo-hydrolase, partial [Anaerococcus vaginalis]|nr:M20/M25/M40 family metallo-hydrolase [Anaerococcus vaginalis]
GVFRLNEPSVHGSDTPKISKRNFDEMEVVIDELVESDEDVKKLGINPGDFIALDSRFRYSNGFVKSRHLDDKASSGVLLALAKEIKEENLKFDRNIYMMFTTYEEVGHGASSGHPSGIKDMIAVDMGVVFDDLKTNDRKVSICAKDSSGPYNFDLTNDLINTAKKIGIDFAIDIYPFYGSDASAAMSSFYDYRHALVGCGISASHGYERCHENALMNLFDLFKTYILK